MHGSIIIHIRPKSFSRVGKSCLHLLMMVACRIQKLTYVPFFLVEFLLSAAISEFAISTHGTDFFLFQEQTTKQ